MIATTHYLVLDSILVLRRFLFTGSLTQGLSSVSWPAKFLSPGRSPFLKITVCKCTRLYLVVWTFSSFGALVYRLKATQVHSSKVKFHRYSCKPNLESGWAGKLNSRLKTRRKTRDYPDTLMLHFSFPNPRKHLSFRIRICWSSILWSTCSQLLQLGLVFGVFGTHLLKWWVAMHNTRACLVLFIFRQ